jgi:hypothetical protein
MIHLESLTVREFNERDRHEFPFDLDIIRSLHEIKFPSPGGFTQ